jgi:hypothetical protein
MQKQLKLFVTKLILLIPVVLIISIPLLVLLKSGELLSIDAIIGRQAQTQGVLGLGYGEPNPQYKLRAAVKYHPQILAMGTSRTMQFRNYFFSTSFYNTGGGVGKIDDLQPFLEALPDNLLPKVLIVGLDQNFFNATFNILQPDRLELKKTPVVSAVYPTRSNNMVLDFTKAVLQKKINMFDIFSYQGPNIGIQAIIHQDGYRIDGSYQYGSVISNPRSDKFDDSFSRIDAGKDRFAYGDSVDPVALDRLNDFLQYCRKKHIYVVGFTPPYAKAVLLKMQQSGKYGYLDKVYPSLQQLFQKYNYPVYDFTDIESYGSSDLETIDGFHGTEVSYLRLLIKMAENDKTLSRYVNLESLQNMLDNRKSGSLVR